MNRPLRKISLLLAILLCCVPLLQAKEWSHQFTVVVDAGHGGKDLGCTGRNANEKSIVLDVAKRVGSLIGSKHPEVKVVYTRSDDRFVELNERARIANRASADLFISIHVNSIDRRTKGRENVSGASVYTLGLGSDRTGTSLAVAMRENSVIELEEDFSENYQGFDPSSTESYIIFELTQNLHQQQSIEFADMIQRELVGNAGRDDKGVRQAGFLVLKATSMPAVLVELDFICNPASERFLNSDEGRRKCAESIVNGFSTYYAKHHPGSEAYRQQQQPLPQQPQQQVAEVENATVTYAIQFLESPTMLKVNDSKLRHAENPAFYYYENLYHYITGNFKSLKDAKKKLRKLQKHYPEAFIIKMRNGVRVLQ